MRDERAVTDFFWQNRAAEPETLLRALARRTDFWGEDLNEIAGFVDQAVKDLENIRTLGMKAAIERVMEKDV